jgi:hypothetical protein
MHNVWRNILPQITVHNVKLQLIICAKILYIGPIEFVKPLALLTFISQSIVRYMPVQMNVASILRNMLL